jgi:hypothetical protein
MGGRGRAPTHDEVVTAVGEADDAEIAGWVADPADYVLVPVDLGAEHHDFFALTPVAADHPIGVLLARGDDGVAVTSGRPDVVWRVLRDEPALRTPDDVVALLARSFDDIGYVGPGSEPPLVATGDGWRGDLLVRRVGRRDQERWRVELGPHPTWDVERP